MVVNSLEVMFPYIVVALLGARFLGFLHSGQVNAGDEGREADGPALRARHVLVAMPPIVELAAVSIATTEGQAVLSKTPYLDRQIPLPHRNVGYARIKWWQAALFLLGLTLGLFRVLFALWILQVLIHELGHLVGGLLVGEQFSYIRVSVLQIDRSGEVSWHWRVGAAWSGATSTLPLARSALRWRLLASTAAGPAANLLFGLLVLRLMPQQDSFIAGACQMFVAGAFFVGFTNLLPLQRRGQMLDGMRLWILLFGRGRRERLISMLNLVADVGQGKAVTSLDDYSLERWASVNDGTVAHVIANWAGFTNAKDPESAGRYLETCLAASSAIDPNFRNELILEAAKYQALRRNRLDLAREWLDDDKAEERRFSRFWAEALILQHEGKFDGAIAKVQDALKYIQSLGESSTHTAQQRALSELKASLQVQASSGNAITQS